MYGLGNAIKASPVFGRTGVKRRSDPPRLYPRALIPPGASWRCCLASKDFRALNRERNRSRDYRDSDTYSVECRRGSSERHDDVTG